ncbi:3-phosphoshikimate 1-carboxyvinyltransferase [Granulosicoccus antarcticus]|uniref:3-phosphoshikimate 1-carboxyvinyltransferase n=1 Tax=Granulosicoccus antarcticus IMCC3135 TaxID=1192854 RepID=A0A2Z2NZH8_9GAMM|nr:3-phosphoshikimate 1-carboxyvinyltransferase [Granulosicoccus antarcticus]ASJ75198.1 3-phosphoshikimate 1-carboxyvinyltransferase [Granulosicoccus antarcticus IMCC3135]
MNQASSPSGRTFHLEPATKLTGTVKVPGDKSMSHRSIMFGGIAHGTTQVQGFLEGEDSLHTLEAFQAMGVRIERGGVGEVTLYGQGVAALKAPQGPVYLGNSGTGMRLLTGLLAGMNIPATLTGDASLSGRPMRRIVDPLSQMGAKVLTGDGGTPPLVIQSAAQLKGIEYTCPMASAQVKSAILLAGLHASGTTTVHEPAITRDHTERMLRGFGVDVQVSGLSASVQGGQQLKGTSLVVPGDISSAAFFLVGASMTPGSDLLLTGVGMNPSRTGVIAILKLMGANIQVTNERVTGGEPVADLVVLGGKLKGIHVPEELVSLAIDEFPALFVAAAAADGETIVTGAEELRVKETDRIQVMADGLRALGADITDTPDGARIVGKRLVGGVADSCGDHRTAMSFAMASLICDGSITVLDCDNVNTSFPGFASIAANAGLHLTESVNDTDK